MRDNPPGSGSREAHLTPINGCQVRDTRLTAYTVLYFTLRDEIEIEASQLLKTNRILQVAPIPACCNVLEDVKSILLQCSCLPVNRLLLSVSACRLRQAFWEKSDQMAHTVGLAICILRRLVCSSQVCADAQMPQHDKHAGPSRMSRELGC